VHWTLGILHGFQAFFRLEFFLFPNRIHARPSAMLRERQPLGGVPLVMDTLKIESFLNNYPFL